MTVALAAERAHDLKTFALMRRGPRVCLDPGRSGFHELAVVAKAKAQPARGFKG